KWELAVKLMQITHRETGTVIARRVTQATNILSRLLGLMFKKDLGEFDGLLLQPCNSIHTFFMRFPIDVVFLSSSNEVVKVIRAMPPWRFSWLYLRAVKTLELRAGTLPVDFTEGTFVEVIHV
ncbi:MAG: DUF192 domain-containing protein, partial [Bacteriovoracia bacterium]